jgi:hypothetical protein
MRSKRRSIQGKPKIKPFAGLAMHSGDADLVAENVSRPSPYPFTDAYRRILNQKVPHDPRRRTFLDLVVEATFLRALEGDLQAIKEITDRVEGRVPPPRPGEREERPTEFRVVWEKPIPSRGVAPTKSVSDIAN